MVVRQEVQYWSKVKKGLTNYTTVRYEDALFAC